MMVALSNTHRVLHHAPSKVKAQCACSGCEVCSQHFCNLMIVYSLHLEVQRLPLTRIVQRHNQFEHID